jgi:thiamine-monophosphate kinase
MNQEFDAISQLFQARVTQQHDSTSLGNGDDASVHSLPHGFELVISTDSAIQGVHWPEDMPLSMAGSRAVYAALSDLAAMGAQPTWIWLAITAENKQALSDMSDGIVAICNQHQLELAGGDTTRASSNAITVTVGGLVPQGKTIARSTAQVGDEVWLLGDIGLSAAGLEAWLKGEKDSVFLQHLQHIKPLYHQGLKLRELGVSSCIDISDGLLQDANHIAKASGVAMHIQLSSIQALPAYQQLHKQFSEEESLKLMLSGGEDYALLFTANTNLHADLKALGAHVIGQCDKGDTVRLYSQGEAIDYQIKGYDHFG